jgi:1,4-alpha-glucan branching enzyme
VDDFNPEDLHGKRVGCGAKMFRFYKDLILLARKHPALRSRTIDVIHAFNATRVIAFTRSSANDQLMVVASFSNTCFDNG